MTYADNIKIPLSADSVPMGRGFTSEPRPRVDPLTQVADIDSLYHGFHAFKWATKNGTTTTATLPIRPTGRLPYEEIYQAAVFVVPALFVVLIALINDLDTTLGKWMVFFAGAAAWFLGIVLHFILQAAIQRKLNKETSLYGTAYFHFRYISASLNLAPSELTYARLKKLHDDYDIAQKEAWANWHKRNSDEAIARAARVNARRFSKAPLADGQHFAPGYDDVDEYGSDDSDYDTPSFQTFNPGSGLPMLDGGVDVGGNPFGAHGSMF